MSKKRKGCKRTMLAVILGLGLNCSAESFYQQYSGTSTNGLAVTNMGINPIFVSGITCKYVAPVTGDVTVKFNDQTLYTISMVSNSTYLLPKSDLAGVWLKKTDLVSVSSLGTTNTIVISTEENR